MIDISGHLDKPRQTGYRADDQYLVVNCCGYQKFMTRDFSRLREHGRLDYQIIYILQGRGTYLLDGKSVSAAAGNIVIYRPGEIQHYVYQCKDIPEVYWVHFTGFGAGELLTQAGFGKDSIVHIGLHDDCVKLYKKTIWELQTKRPLYLPAANAAFSSLLACMGRFRLESINGRPENKDRDIEAVLEHMHNAYNMHWTVEDFAGLCNLSVYYFIHRFKAYTGVSPIQYLTGIRINKAKELLSDSSLSVSEIAYVVGYENPLYFSRVFKRHVGISPAYFAGRGQTSTL